MGRPTKEQVEEMEMIISECNQFDPERKHPIWDEILAKSYVSRFRKKPLYEEIIMDLADAIYLKVNWPKLFQLKYPENETSDTKKCQTRTEIQDNPKSISSQKTRKSNRKDVEPTLNQIKSNLRKESLSNSQILGLPDDLDLSGDLREKLHIIVDFICDLFEGEK